MQLTVHSAPLNLLMISVTLTFFKLMTDFEVID